MAELDHLTRFPPIAKLFIFMFTTLIVLVCLWAVWIYTMDRGKSVRAPLTECPTDVSGPPRRTGAGDLTGTAAESRMELNKNLARAQAHINGQILLFFALGAVFLFTSAGLKVKKVVLWLFGICIVAHTVGQSGAGFHASFDYVLFASGVVLLVLTGYMCFMIYADLGRKRDR